MVSSLDKGHMPGTFFLSEPQLKTTVILKNIYFFFLSEWDNFLPKIRNIIFLTIFGLNLVPFGPKQS